MKKKRKKLFIIIPVAVAAIVLIVVGFIVIRKVSIRAYVQSVSDLDQSDYGSDISYQGEVYESAQQQIYADPDKSVAEVYVKEGDSVKKGDRLFKYDTTLLELDVQEKELSLKICQTALESEQNKLEKYKEIVPVVPTQPVTETEETGQTGQTQSPTSVTETAAPVEIETDETQQAETTYTPDEKNDMVADQEVAVKKAKNNVDSAQEDLDEAKKALEGAEVTANLSGTVKNIKSTDDTNDGQPFCTIQGDSGVTIKGAIGEFDIKNLKEGDKLTVSSYMSDTTTDAEIITISDYPLDSGSNSGGGNPNSSFYEFTAFMEQSDGFQVGEYVNITKYVEQSDDTVILPKKYVMSDSKGPYVFKDKDGTLVRQDVKTEKASSSDAIKITDGLNKDDLIAFPYLKNVRIGMLTTTENSVNIFGG